MDYFAIKKYLEGKTSAGESERILLWLKNPENETLSRKILEDIWNNSTIQLNGDVPDFSAMFYRIYQQMGSPDFSSVHPKTKLSPFFVVFSKIAAVLIFPLLLTSVYLFYNPPGRQVAGSSLLTHEIYTRPGTRTKLQLHDGTLVWLNDGSTFRYPEHFDSGKREVYLDGEAYFEVQSDSEHPFVVDNPMMKMKVTGTQFNLNAYAADHFYEATLLEGEISLMKNNQIFSVEPGERVHFDVGLNKLFRKMVDTEDSKAWIKGQLIFKDEKLGTVIKKLGRWFNVEFIPTEPTVNDYLLSGTFHDETLHQVLEMISFAIPVKFEFKKAENTDGMQRIVWVKKK